MNELPLSLLVPVLPFPADEAALLPDWQADLTEGDSD